VVGRPEEMLSSDVLLSWRARPLVSPMLSASSGRRSARLARNIVGWVVVSCMASGREASVLVGLRTGVGPE
jgi:hypothetical protein